MSCHLGYVPQHAAVALMHVAMLGCFLQASQCASTRLRAFACSVFISHLVYHILMSAGCASSSVSASQQALWDALPAASRVPVWPIALMALCPASVICIRSLFVFAGGGPVRSSWIHEGISTQAPALIGGLLLNWWWHDDRVDAFNALRIFMCFSAGVIVLFIQSSNKCQRLGLACVLFACLVMSAGMLRSHFHIDLEGRSDVSTNPNWAGQLHFLVVDVAYTILSGACGYAVVTYSCSEPVANTLIPQSSWQEHGGVTIDPCSSVLRTLRAMTKKELRLEAAKYNADSKDIEEFRDEEMTKDGFIELVMESMLQKIDPSSRLGAMTKKELRLEAAKYDVNSNAIEQFRDDEMPKDRFIELVIQSMYIQNTGAEGLMHSLHLFKNSVVTVYNMIITNLTPWITAGFYLYIYVQMYNRPAAGTPEHMSDTDILIGSQVKIVAWGIPVLAAIQGVSPIKARLASWIYMGTLAVTNDNNWTHTKPLWPEDRQMRKLLGMGLMGTQHSRAEMAPGPWQYSGIGCVLLLAAALVVIKTVETKKKGASASAEIRVFVRNLGTVLWPDTYRSMRSAFSSLQLGETDEAVVFARASFVSEKMCSSPAVSPDTDVALMSNIVHSVLNYRFASLPVSFPFDARLRKGVGKELVVAMVQYFGLKGELAKLGRPKLRKDRATSACAHATARKMDPDSEISLYTNGSLSPHSPSSASTFVCGTPPAECYGSPMHGHITHERLKELYPCQGCHGATQVADMLTSHNSVQGLPYIDNHREWSLLHHGSSISPSSDSKCSPPVYTQVAGMPPSHDAVHSFYCNDSGHPCHCELSWIPAGWDMEQGLPVYNPDMPASNLGPPLDTSAEHNSSGSYNSSSCIDGSTAAAAALAAMEPAAGATVLAEMDPAAMATILLKMDPAAMAKVLSKMAPTAAAAVLAIALSTQ